MARPKTIDDSAAKVPSSLFGQIPEPELWLPPRFSAAEHVEFPDGCMSCLGSLPVLLEQLDELNRRTWRASDEQLEKWSEAELDPESLDGLAPRATLRLARFGHLNRLALILSY